MLEKSGVEALFALNICMLLCGMFCPRRHVDFFKVLVRKDFC